MRRWRERRRVDRKIAFRIIPCYALRRIALNE